MKNLHQKIEDQKNSIKSKKYRVKSNYNYLKQRISSPTSTLMTMGGLAIGFLLIPKKFKLIKNIFKIYTVAATARQFLDLIPSSETHTNTKKRPHRNNVVKFKK